MGRQYAGVAYEERVRQRRTALLDSALENFGTVGYARTSVKQICGTAGLTERYFYAAFRDREDCLAVLYDELSGRMRDASLAATVAAGQSDTGEAGADERRTAAVTTAGLSAFIEYLTDDARRARVVLIEVVGVSEAMEDRRNAVLSEFADVVRATWMPSEGDRELGDLEDSTAVALVGAVNHLLVDWLQRGQQQPVEHLVRVCATLFDAAADKLGIDAP